MMFGRWSSPRFQLIWMVIWMIPCSAFLDKTLPGRREEFGFYSKRPVTERIYHPTVLVPTLTSKSSLRVLPRKHKPPSSMVLNSMASSLLNPQQIGRTLLGSTIAYKIANSGWKKQSLNKSGAIAAFLVASVAFSCSFRSGMTLLAFYLTGSKLTKLGSNIKGEIERDYATSSGRGAKQVLACSLIAVICSVLRRLWVGTDAGLDFMGSSSAGGTSLLGNQLTLAYVAFFACCAGDTWASELGVLSKSKPRLVTMPWKTVVPGTNGGVSLLGLVASATGGACMGLCHAIFLFKSIQTDIVALLVVGGLSGLGGSMLDSLLGATVQATYYDPKLNTIVKNPGSNNNNVENRGGLPIFSNEMVNVVSSILTALLAAKWTGPLVSLLSVG